MYLLRLDDASEYMNMDKWTKMELLLDKHDIKPIVGIIPNNKDDFFIKNKIINYDFWNKVNEWQHKNWEIAMHGYQRVYISECGGINPIHNRSEFAGVNANKQLKMISDGYKIFSDHDIFPKIFFAPSHTFDINTLIALQKVTNINVICDTIAYDIYYENNFYFIPQQSGHIRHMPLKIVTFCYHPDFMNENDFEKLEKFLSKHHKKFTCFKNITLKKRNRNIIDKLLKKIYFLIRIGK